MALFSSDVELTGGWKKHTVPKCVCGGVPCDAVCGNALLPAFLQMVPPLKKKSQVAYSHLIGHDTAIHLTELKNPTYAYARAS